MEPGTSPYQTPLIKIISLTAEAKMPAGRQAASLGKHFHGLSAGETP
jgi:hypothetical protein